MIDFQALSSSIFKESNGKSPINLNINNHTLPIKFLWTKECDNLVISFHGAVNKKIRDLPVFSPILPDLGSNVAQLSISDPLMLLPGDLGMTWYAGSDKFPAQSILSDLFHKIIEFGGFKRVVFYGSSGGGFAALYFSSLVIGSVAIVGAPQTNIYRYYSGHVKRYIEECWPSLTNHEDLSDKICTDLCNWYSTERHNTVIYLQSPGDHYHTRTQLAPFYSKITQVPNAKFILISNYWGRMGHSGSVPIFASKPWIKTALISPTIEVDDILLTYNSIKQTTEKENSSPPNREDKADKSDSHSLANLLRDYHLRQPLES